VAKAELVVNTEGEARRALYDARRRAGILRACPAAGGAVDSYGCGDSFAAGLTSGSRPA